MKKVCYIVYNDSVMNLLMNVISQNIHGYVDWTFIDDDYLEVTIVCLPRELPYVEKQFAAFV